jgi:hypothetical protein
MSKRKILEFVGTQIRKEEPLGGGLVRLYFAIPDGGAWDEQCTTLMPSECLPDALGCAVASAKKIALEEGFRSIPHQGMVS